MDAPDPARSFDAVVDDYDQGRPGYPAEAVRWVLGDGRGADGPVLELGAGTGKLTAAVVALGLDVVATDPSAPMLARLRQRVPAAFAVVAAAEQVPGRRWSAGAVVSAQAFHWFDASAALRESARVLRPEGVLGVLWNARDERIPWVRRLGELLGSPEHLTDPTSAIDDSGLFEQVERRTFRHWQPLDREGLRSLVRSRSHVVGLDRSARDRLLRKVDDLYDEYGRGRDGMLMPYVTTAYRAVVLPWASPEDPPADPLETDSLLIDFG